ncbi:uncharacterized protein K444DRAFT_615900, partial [Hyaloscypha bicolor E]
MAYANVAIAPSSRSRFVLDERLIQELADTLCNTVREALDDYLGNSRQSVILLTPSLAPAEPLSPPKELLLPCSPAIEPLANKSNSCLDCSPIDKPPSVQLDVPVHSIQPRLPPLPTFCRLLHTQTTPLLLPCTPSASILYISWCLDKPCTSTGTVLVEF